MIQSDLPRPTVGIVAPVLSVTEVVAGMLGIVIVTTGNRPPQHRVFIAP